MTEPVFQAIAAPAPTGEGTTPPAEAASPESTAAVTPPAGGTAPAETPAADPATAPDSASEGQGETPTGAPEAYEDFTMPEGVTLDAPTADSLKTLAKSLNLTQAQAQQIADLGAAQAQRFVDQQQEAIAAVHQQWAQASLADAEIGGAQHAQRVGVALAGIEAVGTPELKALLTESGLNKHPEVIRLFYRIGSRIADDTVVPGGRAAASNAGKSAAELLYPSS